MKINKNRAKKKFYRQEIFVKINVAMWIWIHRKFDFWLVKLHILFFYLYLDDKKFDTLIYEYEQDIDLLETNR